MFRFRHMVQSHVVSPLQKNISPRPVLSARRHTKITLPRPVLSTRHHTVCFTTVPSERNGSKIKFSDAKIAFQGKSTMELINSYFVYKCCALPVIVNNAEKLLAISRFILRDTITAKIIKATFFKHFCAGEVHADLQKPIGVLASHGIGSILDYAAEADLEDTDILDFENTDSAHKYSYTDEKLCDMNRDIFLDCIQAVRDVSPEGFAAIKLTALGNPTLLERMATVIIEIRRLFSRYGGDTILTKEKFIEGSQKYFSMPLEDIEKTFHQMDSWDRSGTIDIIEWTDSISLESISKLVKSCKDQGALWEAALSEEEIDLMQKMEKRLHMLVSKSKQLGVRLMIDAEQTYFQPLIDKFVLDMQRQYNTDFPVVFNTYQCYLKDSFGRLELDMERANREEFCFGAKMVRGAYVKSERERAEEMGYEDPIHDTIENTHANYHKCLDNVLSQIKIKGNSKFNIMVASHNQESVEHTVNTMKEYKIDSLNGGVYFGQLLGMSDHLTYSLAHYGYKAYKYVPYGPVYEVMPYLMRRAHENGGMLGRATGEISMIKDDVIRRMKGKN